MHDCGVPAAGGAALSPLCRQGLLLFSCPIVYMLYYFLAGKTFDLRTIKFLGSTGTGGSVWESRARRGGFIQDVCQSGKRSVNCGDPNFTGAIQLQALPVPVRSTHRLPGLDFL
ncbi:MAG: hypothetical protein KME26_25700 [Oscillatoria princeps RMCB-10]|nr:hypothetical protein [Oscillatoria princeps RMCB-10]